MEIIYNNNVVVPFEIDSSIEPDKKCNFCGTKKENIKYYDMELETLEKIKVPFCESCIKELTKTGVKNNVHS